MVDAFCFPLSFQPVSLRDAFKEGMKDFIRLYRFIINNFSSFRAKLYLFGI
jgi:hypothetical protein